MSRNELLNNIEHKNLNVRCGFSSELGDNVASTVAFITEFAEVQKEYPILFRLDEKSGEYQAVVLFGIQKEENLFLTDELSDTQRYPGWSANYVPAAVERGPFMIGFQVQGEGADKQRVPVVHVDMDHPKISTSDGVSVFLEHGGSSPYLERISNLLNLIRDGMNLNQSMFDAFIEHELLEDISFQIDLANEDKHSISGFKTIAADRLQSLSGEALEKLSRAGFLQAAYFVVASLSNVNKLIEIKNRRLRV